MAITEKRMYVTAALLSGLTVACALQQQGSQIKEGQRVPGAIGNVINLDQNWTDDTQVAFYFSPQGSRILPYSWFLVLEQADSQVLFRDNAHIEQLRYLPSTKLKSWNPD